MKLAGTWPSRAGVTVNSSIQPNRGAQPFPANRATIKECEEQIREAIEFHLEGLREDGLAVPEPASLVEYVEIAA